MTPRLEVEVERDAEGVALRGAATIATAARAAVAHHGSFTLAVSGGTTPWAMFRALEREDVPWDDVGVWQVDERIAPRGHDDRSLTHLLASLPDAAARRIHPMPIDDIAPDDNDALNAAAGEYAVELPDRFDLIHLGLGDDGHTASLAPDDAVVDVIDRDVAITAEYRGRRRMTLTLPVLDRAHRVLWIVAGASKAEAFRKLREGDRSIPASRVSADDQLAILDEAAAAG